MTALITFEACKGSPEHREVARIGHVEVGYVMDLPSDSGGAKSHWSTYLPTETARDLKCAASRREAKQALVIRIAEWFECLGPTFSDVAYQVRREAITIMDLE